MRPPRRRHCPTVTSKPWEPRSCCRGAPPFQYRRASIWHILFSPRRPRSCCFVDWRTGDVGRCVFDRPHRTSRLPRTERSRSKRGRWRWERGRAYAAGNRLLPAMTTSSEVRAARCGWRRCSRWRISTCDADTARTSDVCGVRIGRDLSVDKSAEQICRQKFVGRHKQWSVDQWWALVN